DPPYTSDSFRSSQLPAQATMPRVPAPVKAVAIAIVVATATSATVRSPVGFDTRGIRQRIADVEQRSRGTRPGAALVASFDGLGVGFEGPQGAGRSGNPSDNSLAVGPNHIVQTVNSRMAIFTKKGTMFDTTGKVLYGSVPTN